MYYSLIGTDYFSNCKACGRKVHHKSPKCPFCSEPDPQQRNALGYRVNYTKNLDPSVTNIWKSTRHLRLRILKVLAILIILAIIATSYVLEYPDLMTKYLGLRVNPSKEWINTLSAIVFVLLPISVVVALLPDY